MRLSNFFMITLKEAPNDAEIVSHQLMIRAGLIRKLASGLYTWLPLGLRILRKVEAIIREEMNAIQAQEILMPAIQPAELWRETDRWEKFGPQLLKITDRQKREFCFGPTHEEVVTDLVRNELKSYKQLPLTLYQIQIKFRDEIRPRFGVMRAREFLMKDAYSFHLDTPSLQSTYEKFYQAYTAIFSRLGLTFRAVLADTGSIGGSVSHEFHVLAETGEDLLAYSQQSDYAANIEMAPAIAVKDAEKLTPLLAETFVKTPGIRTVEGQAEYLKIKTKQILKTLLVKGCTKEHPVVALLIRGDHELNPLKAEKLSLVAAPLTMASLEEVEKIAHTGPGFVGPKDIHIPIIADNAVALMSNFICGANQEDTHYAHFNWDQDSPLPPQADLRFVQVGDPSPDGQGTLAFAKGIEVGHIFQLGDKYSQAMNATVLDETGKARSLVMGCYGIGVSRIVAAAIEQHHDEKGILWPSALAPFQVVIIPIGYHQSPAVKEEADRLYQTLCARGIETLLDDRQERPGVMFSDAELIGIPERVVVSDKLLAENQLELKNRKTGVVQLVPKVQLHEALIASSLLDPMLK